MTADHWLFRLDAAAWLRAAAVELAAGDAHLGSRRTAVTHARRAAGMALNAALCAHAAATGDADTAATRWGRSYVDHLRALADAAAAADAADRLAPLPHRCAALARDLLAVSVVSPAGLVQLSRGPEAAARDALALARALVDAVALALVLAPPHDDPADDPR